MFIRYATFNWDDKDEVCSLKARVELLDKLKELVNINPVVLISMLTQTYRKRQKSFLGKHPNRKFICI